MFKLKKYNHRNNGFADTSISEFTEKTKRILLAGLSVTALSILTACGGGGSGTPATGGGSTACTDIPGEPDIMGAITYTPATADSSLALTTVTMHIPVDADTHYIGVILNNPTDFSSSVGATNNGAGGGFITVSAPGVQTLNIPVVVSSSAALTGSIYPNITLCSTDINACEQTPGSGGVAVSYATIKEPTGFIFTRFKNFASGGIIVPTIAQIANPPLACVPTQALAMAPAVP